MSYNPETGMYEGYIYCVENLLNEMKYIGQTSQTISIRWNQHKKDMWIEHNNKFYNAMKKYGVENFSIRELEKIECSEKDELLDKLDLLEQQYIEQFNTYPNGYNSTPGGRSGFAICVRPVSQYSLDGIFISNYSSIDELKQVLNKTCVSSVYSCCMGEIKYAYGYIWRYAEDDLHKYELPNDREIKEAIIRCKSLNKINKYDYMGNLIATYDNVRDASIKENVPYNMIFDCCVGHTVYVGTSVFRFYTDTFDTYKTYRDKPKLVEQYTKDGKFLAVYESTREAGRQNNIPYQSIVSVCSGKQKTAHGYIWRYVEKELNIPDFKYNGNCKPVYQYSKDGKLLNMFKSIKDASATTGLSEGTISGIAGLKKNAISRFIWSYTPLSPQEVNDRIKNKNNKKVYQYDLDGNFVCEFDSIKKAGLSIGNGNQHVAISRCCRGVRPTAYGYLWKFG